MVLAYSGGLDTSIILKWLQDEYGCEVRHRDRLHLSTATPTQLWPRIPLRWVYTQVITFTADLGQGEELEPARAKAQLMGVKQALPRKPPNYSLSRHASRACALLLWNTLAAGSSTMTMRSRAAFC